MRTAAVWDIVPSGISKAGGLEFVMQYAGIKESEVYPIGDSYNDLPMIEAFNGFCVEAAPQEIKDSSSHVYLSVSDCINAFLKQK